MTRTVSIAIILSGLSVLFFILSGYFPLSHSRFRTISIICAALGILVLFTRNLSLKQNKHHSDDEPSDNDFEDFEG